MSTINFDCGCFVTFSADEEHAGVLRSMLACCQQHDRPNQTIEQLQNDGYYFSIEKKYTAPVMLSVQEQLEKIRTKYPNAQILKHGSYPNDILYLTLALDKEKWNMSCVDVAMVVPQGFPYTPPTCFYIDAELRTKDTNQFPVPAQHLVEMFGDKYMISGKFQSWRSTDTLYTAVKTISLALQYGFNRQ